VTFTQTMSATKVTGAGPELTDREMRPAADCDPPLLDHAKGFTRKGSPQAGSKMNWTRPGNSPVLSSPGRNRPVPRMTVV
jgi:hypothetical protein